MFPGHTFRVLTRSLPNKSSSFTLQPTHLDDLDGLLDLIQFLGPLLDQMFELGPLLAQIAL